MSQVTIKINTTGVCEIIREDETGKKKETILRLDANSTAIHAGKEIQIISANAVVHQVTMPDEVSAQLEYDRIADYIAECINDQYAPRHRRSRIGLREVDIIMVNEHCLPTPATNGSAGYDCRVDVDTIEHPGYDKDGSMLTLEPGETYMASLGFYMHIDNFDYEAQLRPRSGKGSKGLVLGNLLGTIDSDYQGIVKACLWNRTDKPLVIDLSEPVCQLVFNRVEHPEFNLVDSFEATERGEGGFGSTDKKAVN